MVKASIIIPTYNSAPYLEVTIQSALAQTYEDIEVIVVDDGSTDDTQEVVERFNDSRLSFIIQANLGPSAARNTGIRRSSGEFLQFLDSDDLILPEKLSTQIALLEGFPRYGLVYSDACYFEDVSPDDLHRFELQIPSDGVLMVLIWENIMPSHAPLIRRACFDEVGLFHEPLRAVEDWDMWLRLAYAGVKFLHHDKVLALYRRRPGSRSSHKQVVWESEIEVLRRFQIYADPATLSQVPWKRSLAHRYLGLAMIFYCHGDPQKGYEVLRQSQSVSEVYYDDVEQVAKFLAYHAIGIGRQSKSVDEASQNPGLNLLCKDLSRLVRTGKSISKRARGIYWKAIMSLAHEQNDPRMVRESFMKAIQSYPNISCNRGTFSILTQSLLGCQLWKRLHWLKDWINSVT